jgi:hypothetical protein
MDFFRPSASVLTSLRCHVNNIDVSSDFLGCDSRLASVWPLAAAYSLLFAIQNDNGANS